MGPTLPKGSGARQPLFRTLIVSLLRQVERLMVGISMVALTAMMLLTVVSVVGRYFFSLPVPDDLVISEMLMVVVVFLPFGAVQAAREHVSVTVFTDWTSSRTRYRLELLGSAVGLAIITLIAAAVFTNFWSSWLAGSYAFGPLEIPEYPARFVVFFGLGLFAVRLLADVVAGGLCRREAAPPPDHPIQV